MNNILFKHTKYPCFALKNVTNKTNNKIKIVYLLKKLINMQEIKEEWRDIEGYENLYQVSNLGNVKALGNGGSNASKEQILKPAKDKRGYLVVCLHKKGKLKTHRVHRLVAMLFIPNPQNLEQVNHKDENKINNTIQNLEWCTNEYNHNYGTRNKRSAESNKNNPNKSKQVMCIETGKIYPSINEVQRQLGFEKGNISYACNGKLKSCGGFHWRYVN